MSLGVYRQILCTGCYMLAPFLTIVPTPTEGWWRVQPSKQSRVTRQKIYFQNSPSRVLSCDGGNGAVLALFQNLRLYAAGSWVICAKYPQIYAADGTQ